MPKSSKSIKKGDENKAWNKRTKPGGYRKDIRSVHQAILIVCEGQTEAYYFEKFPVYRLDVKIENTEGKSKLKLIDTAFSIVKNSKDKYSQVWCVFDLDFKDGGKELADFDNAIAKAKTLGYHVAYSNDSFELWFYLHFNFSEAKNHRDFYYKELSKVLGINYEKEGKKKAFCQNIYSILEQNPNSDQQKAIDNARKLYELKKNMPAHQQNPVTMVYELVDFLNKNQRGSFNG